MKRIIGLAVGVFCTLIVAGLCSYCFGDGLAWFYRLQLPSYVVRGGWFSAFVAICYASCILSIGSLVEHRHIFPSMIFFGILGLSAVLFVFVFFNLKSIVGGLIFITICLAMSYVLFVRFLTKNLRMALLFLPTLIFNIYGFLCVVAL